MRARISPRLGPQKGSGFMGCFGANNRKPGCSGKGKLVQGKKSQFFKNLRDTVCARRSPPKGPPRRPRAPAPAQIYSLPPPPPPPPPPPASRHLRRHAGRRRALLWRPGRGGDGGRGKGDRWAGPPHRLVLGHARGQSRGPEGGNGKGEKVIGKGRFRIPIEYKYCCALSLNTNDLHQWKRRN